MRALAHGPARAARPHAATAAPAAPTATAPRRPKRRTAVAPAAAATPDNSNPQPQPSSPRASGASGANPSAPAPPPSSLDLPRESASSTSTSTPPSSPPKVATPSVAASQRAVKTTGLRRAPLSGGVKTATARYDLPSPAVAVRNLVEQARFAHLCTVMSHMHHRRAGYPFGTLVDFAVDGAGMPLFCLSPLAIHARNLIEDPRASLVVQMPGWTGLANARVTIFGDIYPLPPELQDDAREIFLAKQQATGGAGAASSVSRRDRWVLGSFTFFRMHRITDVYFVGGFGTVQWIDADEYVGSSPDPIATDAPQRTLQVLNEVLGAELRESLGVGLLDSLDGGIGGLAAPAERAAAASAAAAADRWMISGAPDASPEAAMPSASFGSVPVSSAAAAGGGNGGGNGGNGGNGGGGTGAAMAGGLVGIDDAAFISIDALGTDVRVRHGSDFSVERIGFDSRVHSLDTAISAVRASLARARREQAEAAEEAMRRAQQQGLAMEQREQQRGGAGGGGGSRAPKKG
jgi:hypothetical protein